ncbi:MAG: M1 family aminopeptidase, partial [Saprospiraceae bacterium]
AEYDFNMAFYSYVPGYLISDINGFGHFAQPLFWFNLYWLALGTVLLIIGNLFWNRGSESDFKARWKLARQRFNFVSAPALSIALFVFVGSGIYIYYNTAVLNSYYTAKQQRERQANYEKQYSKYATIIQPKITDVKVEADIFPQERRAVARGRFVIVNKSSQAIDSLHLSMSGSLQHAVIQQFTIDKQAPKRIWNDAKNKYSIYKMPGGAMQPGDTMLMEVTIDAGYKGFTNSGYNSEIVQNGTFFNVNIFPSFGYDASNEIVSDQYRKKYNLPVKDYTLPAQDDAWGLSNFLFGDDGDYVTFEAVVSTDPDQIAIAPGYLQKEWQDKGRRYFHYKMEGEMDLFFNISSARYAVHKDTWTNPDGSKGNIEIYHHPTHNRNVARFAKAVKNSVEYFNKYFTPYQYRQMRILEFPRYATFAQSFPNTVPYAESFGWVGNFSNPEKTDYAYTVTAHEVAHQWWGHQITPSATRGANQISESMAEYSSLMVMKQEYGVDAMQQFLKYELDRYLSDRTSESKFEKTLLDNDNQAYVWYRKGGLVLYALQDYIGEDSLNAGFRRFLEAAAFRQKPPFANTPEWYGYIKSVTPDSLKYYLEDSFEKIVLYENRAKKASAQKKGDGTYEVTINIDTRKIYYDGLGKELKQGDQPNLIEIGIFAAEGKNDKGMTKKVPLYLQKHWLKPGEHTLTFTVKGEPVKAGIDPYNKLIDRIADDNVVPVEK